MSINHFIKEWFTFELYMYLTDKLNIVLSEVDSTNNYAKQLIAKKAQHGTVVLAQYQNAGRGQMGNFWESARGENMLSSLIICPHFLDAGKQFLISKIVSLALVEMLSAHTQNVQIKWPNDIYVGDKKIAGILIENTIKGSTLDYSVIGVGLNINQEIFESEAPNPVSLKQLTGKQFDIQQILKEYLSVFGKWYSVLEKGNCEEIDRAYLAQLIGYQSWRTYRREGEAFEAQITGIGDFGQLQLEERNGKNHEFMFKEVEFVF